MKNVLSVLALFCIAGCGTDVDLDAGFAVLYTSPSGGAVNIDPTADIFVVFNQEVDESTVANSITLAAEGAENALIPVALTCAKDSSANQMVQCSHDALAAATTYQLTLSNGLKPAGQTETLGVDISMRFTTAAAD